MTETILTQTKTVKAEELTIGMITLHGTVTDYKRIPTFSHVQVKTDRKSRPVIFPYGREVPIFEQV